jgi:hypothetical protein
VANSTWQVDQAGGAFTVTSFGGLSADGNIVAYVAAGTGAVSTVYRQTEGGAPQAIASVSAVGSSFEYSMSSDGNLVAYTKYSSTGQDSVYLYDASTGKNADLFPANTADHDQLHIPVLSADGSHLALFALLASTCDCEYGVAVKALSNGTSTTVTASDIKVHGLEDYPLAVSDDGGTFAYVNDSAGQYGQLGVYQGGGVTPVPVRADTYPESVSLTGTGSALLYTLWYHSYDSTQASFPDINYPGVFEWQLG